MARCSNSKRLQPPSEMPRKVSLLTAMVVYAGLASICTAQGADDFALSPVFPSLLQVLPWVSGLLLLVAPVAWVRRLQRRRLLNSHNSLQSLRGLSWRDFQHLVGDGFRRQAYAVEVRSTAARAGGIDLVLTNGDRKILVQCRHGDRPQIGLDTVQRLHASMYAERATGGLVVTSGAISDEARAFAADKPIALIEGPALLELVLRSRITHANRSDAPARREPYLGTSIEDLRACSLCGGPMVEGPIASRLDPDPGPWVCPSTRCAGVQPA
jgi:restriction system protein